MSTIVTTNSDIPAAAVIKATINAEGLGKNEALLAEGLRRLLPFAESYLTTAIYDADGVLSAGTIIWPDGSLGVLTRILKDTTWLAVNAFTLTHADSGLTATVTYERDAATGAITATTISIA